LQKINKESVDVETIVGVIPDDCGSRRNGNGGRAVDDRLRQRGRRSGRRHIAQVAPFQTPDDL